MKPSRVVVIVDLEATCWERGTNLGNQEVIEIGAVKVDADSFEVRSEFSRFVKPVRSPVLSPFCRMLTSIRQEDVDRAPHFPAVFSDFLSWIDGEPALWCSWGAYDLKQLRKEAHRHALTLPAFIEERHLNLKQEFAALYEVKAKGMKAALDMVGLPLYGTPHRGIDDARNTVPLAKIVLVRLGLPLESGQVA